MKTLKSKLLMVLFLRYFNKYNIYISKYNLILHTINIFIDEVKPRTKYELLSINFTESDDDTQSQQSSKNNEIENIKEKIYSKLQESDKFKGLNKPEIIIEVLK